MVSRFSRAKRSFLVGGGVMELRFKGLTTEFSGTLNFKVQRALSDQLNVHIQSMISDEGATSVFGEFFFDARKIYDVVKLVSGKDDEFLEGELGPENIWQCRKVLMQGFINFSSPEIRPAMMRIVEVLERDGLHALNNLKELMNEFLEDSIGTTSDSSPDT